ncbi:uncharacterized protein LOC143248385 [Tachypleus tridentatus]|uniref:uncharacterized protein LOC143248385 n=1 Tax=Tachypleus tridentatus TaxID=6853 RepID=UPI003FD02E49
MTMKFAIPRFWRKPTDHSSICYFFMVASSKRPAGKNASAIMYPDVPSTIAPVPHCLELTVPTPPEKKQPSSEESSKSEEEVDVENPGYNSRGAAGERNPYYPNQRLDAKTWSYKVDCRDYIWGLIRDSDLHYSRKSQKNYSLLNIFV